METNQPEPSAAASEPAPAVPFGATFAQNAGLGIMVATMVARLLVPTESAAAGETLWLSFLSLVGATVFLLGRWQAGYRFRCDPLLCVFGIVVLGHFVSGMWLYFDIGQGNKRSAVNLVWEWVSLGAMCCVVRRRSAVVGVVLAIVAVVAVQGLWQYHVDFPALRAEYADRISGATDPFTRFQLEQELQAKGIPVSGGGLRLFADRLASLEPLGPFALANTLGGFLAAALAFGLTILFAHNRTIGQRLACLVVLSPIAYCLVLTKSRTAIVAVAAGIVLLIVHRILNRGESKTTSLRAVSWFAGGMIAIVATAVVAAVSSGGLDEQVISESPKSLQYRLMYWQGTIQTLRETPFFGTGPGNFRQRYLGHKLAASSEEILDPHNIFLDAWCNGGLIALIGLFVLIAFLARGVLRVSDKPDDTTSGRTLLFGAITGIIIVFVKKYLMGQDQYFDEGEIVPMQAAQLVAFLVAWPCIRVALRGAAHLTLRSAATIAACVLTVHLLGAGGFSMPAVMQVLLLLIAISVVPIETTLRTRQWVGLTPAIATICVSVLCLFTVIKSMKTDYFIRRGQNETGQIALRNFGEASMADPLTPKPYRQFAKAAFAMARSESLSVDERMELVGKSLAAWKRAQNRDPFSIGDSRNLAMALQYRWELSPPAEQDDELLDAAVEHIQDDVERYPTNPLLHAELAIAQAAAKQIPEAKVSAKRALQLDDINRQNGHEDRFLPFQILSQLDAIEKRSINKPDAGRATEE